MAKNGKIPQEMLDKMPPAASYEAAVFPTLEEQEDKAADHRQLGQGRRRQRPVSLSDRAASSRPVFISPEQAWRMTERHSSTESAAARSGAATARRMRLPTATGWASRRSSSLPCSSCSCRRSYLIIGAFQDRAWRASRSTKSSRLLPSSPPIGFRSRSAWPRQCSVLCRPRHRHGHRARRPAGVDALADHDVLGRGLQFRRRAAGLRLPGDAGAAGTGHVILRELFGFDIYATGFNICSLLGPDARISLLPDTADDRDHHAGARRHQEGVGGGRGNAWRHLPILAHGGHPGAVASFLGTRRSCSSPMPSAPSPPPTRSPARR